MTTYLEIVHFGIFFTQHFRHAVDQLQIERILHVDFLEIDSIGENYSDFDDISIV